jgi:hypothetical protein
MSISESQHQHQIHSFVYRGVATFPPATLYQHSTALDNTLTIHYCSQHITLQHRIHCNHWRSCAPRPATRARFATANLPRVANLPLSALSHEPRLLHHLDSARPDYATNSTRSHLVPLIRRPSCRNPTMSSIITVRHSILEASSPALQCEQELTMTCRC